MKLKMLAALLACLPLIAFADEHGGKAAESSEHGGAPAEEASSEGQEHGGAPAEEKK